MTVRKKIYNSIPEILLIIIASSIMGFAFNFFRDDPAKVVRKAPAKISDVKLFDQTAAALNSDPGNSTTVSYKQILAIINNPKFLLIDARNPESYAEGHIGNAVNIYPLGDDEYAYMEQIFSLPRDKTIIIYCDGGNCDLSDEVYNTMKEADDFGNVFLYKAGWEEWIAKQSEGR